MKTILVDDELWAMKQFERECAAIKDIDLVGIFDESVKALEYAKENPVDFALLDIEMPEINGIDLSRRLKELYPEMIVVFVTAHEEYLPDFLRVRADYYVLKPYTKKDVENVIERARLLSARLKKRIFIRTFGAFDVFVDGIATTIQSARAKELLALLVEKRGGVVSPQEAFETIWEDKNYTNANASVYRKTLTRLHQILAEIGIEEILVTMPHGRAVNTTMFDCDMYKFLDGDENSIKNFDGEYMGQYSWGEYMLARLVELKGEYD